MSELTTMLEQLGAQAREAYRALATASAEQKTRALHAAASAIRAASDEILRANAQDMEDGAQLSAAVRDRLQLTQARVDAMADAVDQVAALPDPIGAVLEQWEVASNGLRIEKRAVPMGVIGMIYESRPNVTADAAAIAVKAGNAVILRGGSDSARTSAVIAQAMRAGLAQAGLPANAVQPMPTQDRDAVGWMLGAQGVIDIIIPRGGKSLTERVARDSRVPTLLHLEGNCHIYLHAAASAATARNVVHNAKLRRTGICGALESLLVDAAVVETIGRDVVRDLLDGGVEVRGDDAIQALDARVVPARDADWGTEYLEKIISVKMVPSLDAAIAHINTYGSHHTDAIITEDASAADRFTAAVDSAIVMVNASTQFADGGEFGFGAEIGIATGRLHARGPVGAAQLATYKYVVTTTAPEGATRAG
jgi:glutamate-5-semialdehyde dehydrogenase